MPVSKRRKPKVHLAKNAMPARQAAAHFRQLAQMDGTTYPIDGRSHVPADGLNPFTNAWDHARATGTSYAEGVVWRDDTGWIAHAWAVTPDDIIIETTPGFDTATKYKGWTLIWKDAETINGGTDAPQQSVIQTGLTRGGGKWTDMMGRITKNKAADQESPYPA